MCGNSGARARGYGGDRAAFHWSDPHGIANQNLARVSREDSLQLTLALEEASLVAALVPVPLAQLLVVRTKRSLVHIALHRVVLAILCEPDDILAGSLPFLEVGDLAILQEIVAGLSDLGRAAAQR